MSEEETIEIPVRDLAFLTLNLSMAVGILKEQLDFSEKELKEFDDIYEKYIAVCYSGSMRGYKKRVKK